MRHRLPSPAAATVLGSRVVKVPAAEVPLRAPSGFRVGAFAEGLTTPREMAILPGGDVLVVETSAGRIARLRDADRDGRADKAEPWVDGLAHPYGIALHEGAVFVACTDSVWRVPLDAGDNAGTRTLVTRLVFRGAPLWGGGHSTRDILFAPDGKHFFVSVGSRSNNDEDPPGRAAILEFSAAGGEPTLFATGLRNPVSIAFRPGSDEVWTTVNERDRLGNDLVPDYVTRVKRGGFYGWPFFYLGPNPDPAHAGKHPELAKQVIVPDIWIQSHSAPLGLAFYTGTTFPEPYHGALFVGLHGSWNRDPLVGYKVIVVKFNADGTAQRRTEEFLTGFIKDERSGEVYGRPVAPFVLPDGSLLVSDDGAGRIWRVSYDATGRAPREEIGRYRQGAD
jgi:glucose/arabinose dehydrogenase